GALTFTEILGGWDAQKDVRPRGSPVGLFQSADGSLWFVEDKNRTVMVVLPLGRNDSIETTTLRNPQETGPSESIAAPNGWTAIYGDVIRPRCGQCHAELNDGNPQEAWTRAMTRGWVQLDNLNTSKLFLSMLAVGAFRQMPPPPATL